MTNTFKRIVSVVLSFVMAMTCLVFVNVTSVSAYVPETVYKYYANATDASNNGDSSANNAKNIFTNGTTGSNAFTADTYNVEGKDYELNYCSGNVSNITVVVPEGVVNASLSIVLKSYNTATRTITFKKNGVAIGSTKSVNTATVLNYTGLSTGTYILACGNYVRYSLLTLKVPATCTISGTVTDSDNNPIKCATVYLDGENSFQTRTEEYGDYSITLPCDNYTIKVTALERIAESRTVTANDDVTADFVLQKSGDKVQTYKYYGNATSASSNYDSLNDNATSIFPNMTTYTNTGASYQIASGKINVGGSTYKLPYTTTAKSSITIVVPQAVEHANFYGAFKINTTAKVTFTLKKNGVVVDSSKSMPGSSSGSIEYTDLSDGTYTLTTNYSVYPALLMLTTSPYHIASGTVTDIEGNPIKCATVDTSWGIKVVTDNEGKYSVRVPDGKNTFTVSALEYTSGSKSFTAKSDITVNFKLEKYGNKVKTYKYYGNATSASSNYDSISDNATSVFPNMTTYTNAGTSYQITSGGINMGGSTYKLPYTTTAKSSITIAVPKAVEHANFYGAFKINASSRVTFTLSKNGKVIDNSKTLPASSAGSIEYMDLSGGTYTLTTNYSVYPALLMLTTSAEHVVSGVVTNTDEEPIKCAKITTSWGLETRTDDEGKYTVGVPEGTNTITVTALGYTKGSETFTLDEDIDIDFTLTKDRNYVYKFYGNATDAAANYDSINDNATSVFTNATTATNAITVGGEFIVEGSAYKLNNRGAGRTSYTIVVPEGVDDAELYVVAWTSAVNTVTLKKNGTAVGSSHSMSSNSVGNYTYTGLKEGTYTLTSTSSIYPMLFMLATSPVYTISGTVTNTVGEPMKSAHVYIGDKKLTTDKNGKYTVDVGVDNTITNIRVTALGYKEKNEEVSINGEAVQDIVIHKNRNTIHKFYGNATDATANYDSISNNATDIFTNASTSTYSINVGGNIDIEGSQYKLTHRGSGKTSHTIVVPEGVDDGELYMVWYTSAVNTVKLNKNGKVLDTQSMSSNSIRTFIYRDLTEGTYTFTSTSNIYPVVLILATSPVYTLSGTVTNANGNPIKCGNVYVGDDARLRTDGTGGYTIDVAEGATINNIKVTALGYEDKDESVSISDETTNDIVVDNGDKDIVYKFFSNQNDAVRNYDSTANNNRDVFPNAITGSTSIASYGGGNFDIEGSTFKLYFVSNNSRTLNVVMPEGVTDADLYIIGKASSTSSTAKLTLSKDGDVVDNTKTMPGSKASTVEYDGLSEGTYTIKSDKSFKYSLLAIAATQDELPVITEENVTSGVKVVSDGMASDLSGNSLFAEMLEDLNPTDKLFTLVGMVTGQYRDSTFMNKINQVGFVLYDADVVDSLGEDAKTMNPRELKANYSDADFAGVTIKTGNVYKNYYDEGQYDESLDSEKGYTGEATFEESENKSYFAYVVALSEDKRYYAYPFTLYNGTNINSYDESITDKIEIAYNGVTTSYINNNVDESVEINTEDTNTENESVESTTENTTENITENTSAESGTTESTSTVSEETK